LNIFISILFYLYDYLRWRNYLIANNLQRRLPTDWEVSGDK